MHSFYNRQNFPLFIMNDGPWDIYANEAGRCAAIPQDDASGHKASDFGNLDHVRLVLRRRALYRAA